MKKTIINKRWIFFVLLFFVLILLGFMTLGEETGISIAIISTCIILILGYALIMPNGYTFSSEGITVRYCFGLKTFLSWKDIKHIEDHCDKCFPWWREYEIVYFKTKIPFHEIACIPKNKKTTEMIRKYYRKTIEKYG
ncbi:MAG: hypothetical protein IJB65_06195 [Clostridia bacterium]|nr:hypothetical protein [Clostridia bacterium]